MRKIIKEANSEKLLELIEECKGKGKVKAPVAIIIMGFDTHETDEILSQIAETEGMKIVDYAEIARKMNYKDVEGIEKEWKRQINESMMNYRGVIVKRNFGDNFLTRTNMIKAAMTGMKLGKVILLRLSTDSMRGFMYHREKFGEEYSAESRKVIADNISYDTIKPNEHIHYEVNLTW